MMRLVATMLLATLAGCTLPQTSVKSGSSPPVLTIKGAPADSVLYVDGLQIGPASRYDGNPTVLAVLQGVHRVEVREGDRTIYADRAFVSSGETHVITIVSGAAQ